MAYTPRTIKDRVAVGDDIFLVEDLGNNRIKLTPTPTHISEAGTPVNKALLQPIEDELGNLSSTKVDKVTGKGLSTEDFTTTEKNKLAGIDAGAQVNRAISSQAQAQGGTDNSTVMTPLRVKQAIDNKFVLLHEGTMQIKEGEYVSTPYLVNFDNPNNLPVLCAYHSQYLNAKPRLSGYSIGFETASGNVVSSTVTITYKILGVRN